MQVVTLTLSGETLAVPTRNLREILEPVPVTRVPRAGRFAFGLINVRGAVIPLTDLRVALGMTRAEPDEHTRMLVLDVPVAGEQTTVAVIADRVLDVTEIDDAALGDIPEVGMKWPPEFLSGIARTDAGFVILPDLERIYAASLGTASGTPQYDKEI
ncbi:chemotaxis protein CheW [Rhodovulum euryhalinum]|uniref:Purine-binding chemotaxis protein CheW n=1 Tax=Rhodovulum euryhalinum TaxID=35805 RepID=A0A4R2KY46_9RHOB|nr:chemotaxis protein CheW [Rhodovulum euryhalinum]TCO71605.1 purine-binding chemotaxis protein CheW [Rhodovulum euryhalinum]